MAAETTYVFDVGSVIRHGLITEYDAVILGFKDRHAALTVLKQIGDALARDNFRDSPMICVTGIVYKHGQQEERYDDSEMRPEWLTT